MAKLFTKEATNMQDGAGPKYFFHFTLGISLMLSAATAMAVVLSPLPPPPPADPTAASNTSSQKTNSNSATSNVPTANQNLLSQLFDKATYKDFVPQKEADAIFGEGR
jgi:hypothetical protein